jgi:hypothetical protein
MNTSSNLPVHAGGSLLSYSTPEEYAAAIKANHDLMAIVEQHNEGNRYASEADNEDDDQQFCEQFLWGQDFDTNPEVWTYEIDPSVFEDEGLFGPNNLRNL